MPTDGLVHSIIESQARDSPNMIAIQFENESAMTYRELNETVNAVARSLRIGRGAFVPILTLRSLHLIVAILAVMKTGAAYVILSPDTPDERNVYIINDLHTSFVITDRTIDRTDLGVDTVSIEDIVSEAYSITSYYRNNLDIYQSPSECAYVVYTSGTIGTYYRYMYSI